MACKAQVEEARCGEEHTSTDTEEVVDTDPYRYLAREFAAAKDAQRETSTNISNDLTEIRVLKQRWDDRAMANATEADEDQPATKEALTDAISNFSNMFNELQAFREDTNKNLDEVEKRIKKIEDSR